VAAGLKVQDATLLVEAAREAAAIANWNWPCWAERPDERARVSEIRRDLTELLMRAYRAARERRSEPVREDEVERETYLLKYALLISM
jgi:hypothetical protein